MILSFIATDNQRDFDIADQGAVAGYLMVKGVCLFLESKS